MAYERINWQNEPSEATAINNINLNKMDSAIYELDGKATATDTAITNLQNGKVDKVTGKGLSQVDNVTVTQNVAYGTVVSTIKTYKQDGTEVTSQVCNGINVDSALSDSSTNPVQNKVVKSALDEKVDKEIGKGLSTISGLGITAIASNGDTIVDILAIDQYGSQYHNYIKNGVTIDSAISQTSTNPVQNKAIYDALNNLLPSKTVSGNPIAISDASGLNAKALTVSMNPIQDLHGYEYPWVGGVGKNKLATTLAYLKSANTSGTWSGNSYAENGVTFEVLTDTDDNVTGIKVTGTASARTDFRVGVGQLVTGTEYALNGCPANGSDSTYRLTYLLSSGGSAHDRGSGTTFTANDYANQYGYIRIANGYTIATGGLTFYPMVRLATVIDATFAPYSNICPISGRTEASVTRIGKNRIAEIIDDGNYVISGYGKVAGGNPKCKGDFMPGTYILSVNLKEPNADNVNLSHIRIWVIKKSDNQIYTINPSTGELIPSSAGGAVIFSSGVIPQSEARYTSNAFKINEECSQIRLGLYYSGKNVKYDKLQIELGSTATDYEPYVTPETKTHQYSEEIYGGTDDFVNGEATVNFGFITLDGSEDWVQYQSGKYFVNAIAVDEASIVPIGEEYISNMYTFSGNGNSSSSAIREDKRFYGQRSFGRFWVYDSSFTTLADFKAMLAVTPLQIAYPLATPTTISTSAEEITLLKGNNVLSTNADDIELKYSVSLDSLLPTTTRTLAKSPIVEEPKEETDETEEQR